MLPFALYFKVLSAGSGSNSRSSSMSDGASAEPVALASPPILRSAVDAAKRSRLESYNNSRDKYADDIAVNRCVLTALSIYKVDGAVTEVPPIYIRKFMSAVQGFDHYVRDRFADLKATNPSGYLERREEYKKILMDQIEAIAVVLREKLSVRYENIEVAGVAARDFMAVHEEMSLKLYRTSLLRVSTLMLVNNRKLAVDQDLPDFVHKFVNEHTEDILDSLVRMEAYTKKDLMISEPKQGGYSPYIWSPNTDLVEVYSTVSFKTQKTLTGHKVSASTRWSPRVEALWRWCRDMAEYTMGPGMRAFLANDAHLTRRGIEDSDIKKDVGLLYQMQLQAIEVIAFLDDIADCIQDSTLTSYFNRILHADDETLRELVGRVKDEFPDYCEFFECAISVWQDVKQKMGRLMGVDDIRTHRLWSVLMEEYENIVESMRYSVEVNERPHGEDTTVKNMREKLPSNMMVRSFRVMEFMYLYSLTEQKKLEVPTGFFSLLQVKLRDSDVLCQELASIGNSSGTAFAEFAGGDDSNEVMMLASELHKPQFEVVEEGGRKGEIAEGKFKIEYNKNQYRIDELGLEIGGLSTEISNLARADGEKKDDSLSQKTGRLEALEHEKFELCRRNALIQDAFNPDSVDTSPLILDLSDFLIEHGYNINGFPGEQFESRRQVDLLNVFMINKNVDEELFALLSSLGFGTEKIIAAGSKADFLSDLFKTVSYNVKERKFDTDDDGGFKIDVSESKIFTDSAVSFLLKMVNKEATLTNFNKLALLNWRTELLNQYYQSVISETGVLKEYLGDFQAIQERLHNTELPDEFSWMKPYFDEYVDSWTLFLVMYLIYRFEGRGAT